MAPDNQRTVSKTQIHTILPLYSHAALTAIFQAKEGQPVSDPWAPFNSASLFVPRHPQDKRQVKIFCILLNTIPRNS